jgi:hypothetical protein
MGIFKKLFGGGSSRRCPDLQMAEWLSTLIMHTDMQLSLKSLWSNSEHKSVIVGYYFGFIDSTGQANGWSEDSRIAMARKVFSDAFQLNSSETEDVINLAIECSQTPKGRQYMMEGAQALGMFSTGQAPTPGNTRLMRLLADAAPVF